MSVPKKKGRVPATQSLKFRLTDCNTVWDVKHHKKDEMWKQKDFRI